MNKFLRISLIFLFVFLIAQPLQKTFASAPNISSYPDTINSGDEFMVKANMDGLSGNATYRLRLVLATSGTSNYFGSTFNGSDWYNGTPSPIDYSKFLSITTDGTGAWSGEIKGKVELNDPNYKNTGPSNYDLKIGRYTQSGSSATWSNVVQTKLIAPIPTPTPVPTSPAPKVPTPTKSSTATKSISSSTPAKTVSSSSTTIPTSKSNVQTTTSGKTINLSGVPTSILGTSTKSTDKKSSSGKNEKVLVDSAKQFNIVSFLPFIIGALFLIACGILVTYKIRKNHAKSSNNQ